MKRFIPLSTAAAILMTAVAFAAPPASIEPGNASDQDAAASQWGISVGEIPDILRSALFRFARQRRITDRKSPSRVVAPIMPDFVKATWYWNRKACESTTSVIYRRYRRGRQSWFCGADVSKWPDIHLLLHSAET